MRRYFGRKLFIYLLTFFLAVTIDWLIPRFMPGDPVQTMLSRAAMRAESVEAMTGFYSRAFGLDLPVWQQYLNFWRALFHGDLGVSIFLFPTPVTEVIMNAVPYDIFLLLPAILLSWYAGNKFAPMLRAAGIWITRSCRSGTFSQRPRTCGWEFC